MLNSWTKKWVLSINETLITKLKLKLIQKNLVMEITPKYMNQHSITTNLKLLNNRRVLEGRVVECNSLCEYKVRETFVSMGWDFLINLNELVHPTHLKEFYAGFLFDRNTCMVTCTMYNQRWSWTMKNFCDLLDIPSDGPRLYVKTDDLSDVHVVEPHRIIATICNATTNAQATHICVENLLPNALFGIKYFATIFSCKEKKTCK